MKAGWETAFSFYNICCNSQAVRKAFLLTIWRSSSRRNPAFMSHSQAGDVALSVNRRKRRRCEVNTAKQTASASVVAATSPKRVCSEKPDRSACSTQTPDIDKILHAEKEMSDRLSSLKFSPPVTHIYNPLVYAWSGHEW